jgi:hypothetical protein
MSLSFGATWRSSEFYAARARDTSAWIGGVAAALGVAYAILIVATDGAPMLLAPLGIILVVGAIVLRPVAGLYMLAGIAVLLEQFDLPRNVPITAQTHIYQNISAFTPIPLRLSPVDLLLLLTLASCAVRHLAHRERPRVGPFAVPVALYLGAFALGAVIGIARGAGWDPDATLAELRGPMYAVVLYFLSADLIRTRSQLVVIVWTFIALIAVKALQGIATYMTTGGTYEEVTGHEDVIFFNVGLALALVALVLGVRTRLAVAAMAVAPFIMAAELFTQRRAGFVGLAVIGIAVSLLFLVRQPRRGMLMLATGVLCVGAYLPLFWDDDGPIGQPIRALRAAMDDPDVSLRDQLSDEWRVIENANIAFTLRQVPLTGVGVGQEYFFQQEPPRLPASFTFWRNITHNALMWLWLKAGPFGAFALWFLVARVILTGSAIWARLRDPELRLLATIPIAFLIGQIIFSSVELGLTYSRTMILLGVTLGTASFLAAASSSQGENPLVHRSGRTPCDPPRSAQAENSLQ